MERSGLRFETFAQIGTKLKSNCDKTQKLKLCTNWDKTKKIKLRQNSTQIVTKNSNLLNSKTQIVTVVIVTLVTVAVVTVVIVTSLRKDLTPRQPMKRSCAAFRDSCDVYIGFTPMKFELVQIVRKA